MVDTHPVWSGFTLVPGEHFRQVVSARPEYFSGAHFLHGMSGRGEEKDGRQSAHNRSVVLKCCPGMQAWHSFSPAPE